jgi:hypothetical protein
MNSPPIPLSASQRGGDNGMRIVYNYRNNFTEYSLIYCTGLRSPSPSLRSREGEMKGVS